MEQAVQANSPSDEVTEIQMMDYRAYLTRLATRKIKGFCGTIDEKGEYLSRIYAGHASATDSITADYHGRFLIELIQNANDVHPEAQSDGEIEIVFDQSSGEHGTLYIANRGAPFSEKNVNALCDMGLSSKPPGESIGNKGLGFRSVHHITDIPLIYSQAEKPADANRFHGYCFGFADDTDLDILIADPRQRTLAQQDLPLFHVPKWLDDQPETITGFAERGFSTVISLPLRDVASSEAVEKEISAIRSQTAPLLLFLTRLERLTFRSVSSDCNTNTEFSLVRAERPISGASVPLAIVYLAEGGKFLVARRRVSEKSMKVAIKDGIDKKQLHKHWQQWEGTGEVALAVCLDDVVSTPRLYTFLPMGEQATAPFSGYLHGSFFPSSNRKGLDASIKLNALLLDEATMLAAETIVFLTHNAVSQMDDAAKACAVVDLLSWKKVNSLETDLDLPVRVAKKVATLTGKGTFDDSPVIPCLGSRSDLSSIVWCAPAQSRCWPYELDTFSSEVAAAHAEGTGVTPIWPGLDQQRMGNLNSYLKNHSRLYLELPAPAERAELATRIASDLMRNRRLPFTRWSAFYRDLALFLDRNGGSLAGRDLLLCADEKLRRTMTPTAEVEGKAKRRRRRAQVEASVFAPPARRGAGQHDDDHLTPPDSLTENFAFLSNKLDWYGEELTPARLFLENAKLVFEFNREVVLAQLSRSIRQDGRKAIMAAGLRWAFQIWRQARATPRPVKLQSQHHFSVPNLNGDFIDARSAVFSETWPAETFGPQLQRFLNSAPTLIDELKEFGDRRLAPRSHYVFKGHRSVELLVEFLIELGVQKGLRPVPRRISGTISAHRLKNFSFCRDLGISETGAAAWKSGIEAYKDGATRLPSTTEYEIRGDMWWMPGQGDLDQLSRECREHYAILIIAWLGSAHLPNWTVEVRHSYFYNSDTRDWPTPVAAFLQSASWIPADDPSTEGARPIFVKPSEIWVVPEGGTERFPSYLRRPAIPVMRTLERLSASQLQMLQTRVFLRVLNHPETLMEQAEFLAEQYATEGFDRYWERHFLNLYHKTWSLLADRVSTDQLALNGKSGPQKLVVRRGHQTEVIQMHWSSEDKAELVYVRDGDDETKTSLIEASGKLLFDPRSGSPVRIGAILRNLYGGKVRLLSEAHYSMLVDGQPVGAGDVAPLSKWCPRLHILVAIAMEALKGLELQQLPPDRSLITARVNQLNLQRVTTVSFQIDGVEVSQEIEERRAFALKLPSGEAIVVVRGATMMSWAIIEESLGAICEAIERPALEPHLQVLVSKIANTDNAVGEIPSMDLELDMLCGFLRLGENAKRSVRETLGARLERLVPWLRAIIHMGGGAGAVDVFAEQEAAAVKDLAQLREAISPWLRSMELDANAVLEACKSKFTIAEFREALNLDFERLNRSLVAVGEKPDTYEELHKSLVANYVYENELGILDALRTAHAAQLMRNEPAWGYRVAREAVRTLAPDGDWLLRYKDVSLEQVTKHVAAWLKTKGADELGFDPYKLEHLDEVRRSNGIAVSKFVKAAKPLVKVWCSKTGVAVPPIWGENDDVSSLREKLDGAGIFDFKSLSEPEVLNWSAIVGAWPIEMPRSLERKDLGIVDPDFDEERRKTLEEAESRKREARSIAFNGRKVDPENVDLQSLSEELAASLSKKMLSTPLGAQASLLPAKERTGSTGRLGLGGRSSNVTPRAPSQKTDLIGRLGELAVYHWLRDRLPRQNIDAAWLSENSSLFTGRKGDDSLGYDFEVTFRKQIWHIEVKASLGDPCFFEMGESEVRAGRAAARSRSGVQYSIAYVSYLSEPANARVEMLPNPMSEQGEAVLSLLGEGLRYGFRRT